MRHAALGTSRCLVANHHYDLMLWVLNESPLRERDRLWCAVCWCCSGLVTRTTSLNTGARAAPGEKALPARRKNSANRLWAQVLRACAQEQRKKRTGHRPSHSLSATVYPAVRDLPSMTGVLHWSSTFDACCTPFTSPRTFKRRAALRPVLNLQMTKRPDRRAMA